MKILYVTTRAPYPPHKGDQLIAFEQLRNLPEGNYEVYLVSFITHDNEKKDVIARLRQYCKEIFFIKVTKLNACFNAAKTLINQKPLQVNMYTSSLIKKRIGKIFNQVQPDLVHIQTVRLGELLRDKPVPKMMDMIDVLSLNMKRRAEKENKFLKGIFNLEAFFLKRYERTIVKDYQVTSVVSQNDVSNSHFAATCPIRINPNGTYINREYLAKYKDTEKENFLIFHGNMRYFPNIEAVLYFTKEVWPTVIKNYPGFKLYIVGKDPADPVIKLHGENNIVVTGFVEDICDYLCKAKIGVYPLNSGTGMQNKILEALACGVPTVASNLALQGIADITTNEVLVANTKQEYIKAIELLINDEAARKKYLANGQKFINDRYSWKKNVESLGTSWREAVCIWHQVKEIHVTEKDRGLS
ncbi:glycosyltransferase family 4 protein [Anaerospora sp.]|uniref:glycosyltransferase family 4 protein n=1 Tax=Anaerospora sp. TaxID=1960278 RepID=UPI002896C7E1|nr:glycosyltransferase family 4 protein [Anaerospora sp.]